MHRDAVCVPVLVRLRVGARICHQQVALLPPVYRLTVSELCSVLSFWHDAPECLSSCGVQSNN
jgi:hypothetical protein